MTSLDERLREELNRTIVGGPCFCCGAGRTPTPVVDVSRGAGVPLATLNRFRAGSNVSAKTLSAIDAWLEGRRF